MAELNKKTGTYEFNEFAAGARRYGLGMRSNATSGPVSATGKAGYAARDAALLAKKARQKQIAARYGASGYAMRSTPLTK
jgi:hypothetical protein